MEQLGMPTVQRAIYAIMVCVFAGTILGPNVSGQTVKNHNLTTPTTPAVVPVYRICGTSPSGQPRKVYYSGIFQATSKNGFEAKNAFREFLAQKYSYKPDPSASGGMDIICTDVNTDAEAEQVRHNYLRGGAQNGIVDTGWRYNSGMQAGSMIQQPASQNSQADNMLPAGTAVKVRMIDAIDSNTGGIGARYRASISQLATDGAMIPTGSAAEVALIQTAGGWTVQLASVTINGEPVAVSSSSATVVPSAQSAASSAAEKANSMLRSFGRKSVAPAAVTAIASGQRVVLPPGTELKFVLSGNAPAGSATMAGSGGQPHAVAQAGHAAAVSSTNSSSMSGAPTGNSSDAAQQGRAGSVPMFCHAVTTNTSPPTAYVSPVIAWGPTANSSADSTMAWSQYLTKNYPAVRFDSQVQCVGASVQGIQQDRTDYITQKNKVRNKFKIVEVNWKP